VDAEVRSAQTGGVLSLPTAPALGSRSHRRSLLPRPEARELIQPLTQSVLFFAVISVLLTLSVPGLGGLGRNLLFSECIGLAIVGAHALLQLHPSVKRLSGVSALLLTTVVAVPAGYAVGRIVGLAVLAEPLRVLDWGQPRVVPYLPTILAAVIVLHFSLTRDELAKEVAARGEAQRLAAESELRLLRAQIEPHMLFNTLANLRSLIDEDGKQAQRMLDQLITYLRAALVASRTESTTLYREFAQLRAYLDLMAVRMGPRLTYRLELPEALQQAAVPPMLLQPLVENAVKHGLEPKIGGGSVAVTARQTDTAIEISVTDSGLGLPADDLGDAPTNSYGLVYVRQRLSALYGPRASLTLSRQTPQGVCATVRIPQ
jgi:signal transduction histidine kinase